MYKNIRYGLTHMGQTTIFKLRFSNVEDELFTKIKAITHWQESIVTEYKGKKYFTIVGAFPASQNYKFQTLKDLALNKRKFNEVIAKAEILDNQLNEIDCYDSSQFVAEYQAKFMLDSF